MDPYAVSHFSDRALLHDLKSLVARDRRTTAILLTRIAEVDQRQLFRRAGYESMHAYCLRELHFSEDAAYRHITAARVTRQYPAVLVALADGRLHMRAVLMLAPHLKSWNADELVAAATHKTRDEIELLLAERFPRPDLPQRLQPIPSPPMPSPVATPPAPERVGELAPERVEVRIHDPRAPQCRSQLAPERVEATMPEQTAHGSVEMPRQPAPQLAPERVETPAPRQKMTPLAPERFGLQVTLDKETYDLLLYTRSLMSHQNPADEIVLVLNCALKLLAAHLEKQKFAATTRPRPGGSRNATATRADAPTDARHVPAAVKCAVWERDGGRCTFISDTGQRCPARSMLEFDHVEPASRGGEATMEGIRLLCRAHNQYAAERTFGSEFMSGKRAENRTRAIARKRAKEQAGPPSCVYVGAP